MGRLHFLTSGESHGKCLLSVLDGIPAGLALPQDRLDGELARRQMGHGRGGRMKIETDRVQIQAGLRNGFTIGGPLGLLIENKDFKINELPVVTRPRPGHADLTGAIKFGRRDIRDILERASARETASRVAIGAVCKLFLEQFGIGIISHVTAIGDVRAANDKLSGMDFDAVVKAQAASPVRCADKTASDKMVKAIDDAQAAKDTLGGVYEIRVRNLPVGLGSYTQWDRKLDGRLAQAILSIQAHKAVELGDGTQGAAQRGSAVHDELFYDRNKSREGSGLKFFRKTNRAGGIEGGMTNGEDLVLRAFMKPISTLMKPLASVDIQSKEAFLATVERSDTCAVPAAGIVGEAAVAFVLADAFLEKFGGDGMDEIKRVHKAYAEQVSSF